MPSSSPETVSTPYRDVGGGSSYSSDERQGEINGNIDNSYCVVCADYPDSPNDAMAAAGIIRKRTMAKKLYANGTP
jgi:hypothetical protein